MLRRQAVGAFRRPISSRAAPLAQKVRSFATVKAEEKDPVELDSITTLPNGIRVASEALPGHFSGIGVFIDAGSRYEDDSLRGVSHIIDRLAFKSTSKRSADEMLESLETLGGNIQCASSRESLMYQSATFNSEVSTTVELLSETIRDAQVTDEEVAQQLETADYEVGEIWSKPELILPELVHIAAYKDNTLGNPILCPKERLSEITRDTVQAYRREFLKPERMVVAFAGVDHESAVKLTEKYFGSMKKGTGPSLHGESSASSPQYTSIDPTTIEPPTYSPASQQATQEPSRLLSKIPFLKNISTSAQHSAQVDSRVPSFDTPLDLTQPAHYTGGFLTLPPLPAPPNPALPALSHIQIAFESLPISHPDVYALATLQTLLGGGGSFSAGGPGKGMYSRLYTNVLNQHGWVESCQSFNHSYTDSGLFGIAASCIPGTTTRMLDVMCREFAALGSAYGHHALNEGEVSRAKNQLKSSLLMNLESRTVELEDLGRQVQIHGRRVGVKEMCAKIDALTVKELRRVATEMFSGRLENPGKGSGAPTVVLWESEIGNRKQLQWAEIQERIASWKLGRR